MEMRNETDKRWMKVAYEEGLKALDEGEVPIGAVVVKDGRIIGRGHNRTEALKDPTAHAEIIAITSACNTLGDWRLNGSSLYVTVEPCLMCGGAVIHSRIDRIVYGIKEPKFGSFGSVTDIFAKNKFNHEVVVEESSFLAKETMNLMKKFFESKRERDGQKQKIKSV